MNNIFNPDNAFFSFMNKAFDLIVLNVLWLLLCIPIVTIVPATAAFYYATVKVIRRGRSYAAREFWRSFRLNLRQGSFLSILAVVVAFVLYVDFRYSFLLAEQGESSGNMMFGVFLVVAFVAASVLLYVPPVLSRFTMTFGKLLKTSFFMATRHVLTTIALLVLWALVLLGCATIYIGVIFLPGAGILLTSFLMERVFKRYMPAKSEEQEGEEKKDEWYLE